MSERFPITEEQFYVWLEEKPNAPCNQSLTCSCPIANAVCEIAGRRIAEGCPIVLSGISWVENTAHLIDGLPSHPWSWTRGDILKALKEQGKSAAARQETGL